MNSKLRTWMVLSLLCAVALWPPPAHVSAQAPAAAQPAATATAESAKTWLDRHKEIEEYMKTAEIVKITEIPIGVTKPKRAYFAPGGPIETAAWKPLPPGLHRGFWDSYKADIAGYEMDKLLGLNMTPPTVERRHKGDNGALIMWVAPVKMWNELTPATTPRGPAWDKQLRRMKMFDALIYNEDRNAGNLLIDPAGNLILIDTSRGFLGEKKLPKTIKLERIDVELWDKMKALTEADLEAALSKWIGKREIKSILERREIMQKQIDQLVAANGEANVFVK